jgi:hypothetical protein
VPGGFLDFLNLEALTAKKAVLMGITPSIAMATNLSLMA